MSCQKFYLSSQFELKLIMTKNITRVVMKPLFKNDLPIIKKSFNKDQYENFQRKHGILSQQIITQKCLENRTKMRPLKSCNIKMQPLIKWKVGNSYTYGKKLLNKRSELASKYMHLSEILLMNLEHSITWWLTTDVSFCYLTIPL